MNARRRARKRSRGSIAIESVVLIGLLGLAVAASMVTAGVKLHDLYRRDRTALASAFP